MRAPRWRTAATLLVLTPALHAGVTAQPASAYCWYAKWGTGVNWVEIWAESNISSGQSTNIDSMRTLWNNLPSSWGFSYYPPGMYGPVWRGGWIGNRDFSNAGYGSAPGISISNAGSTITWSDTYLNTDYTWNSQMNQASMYADTRTVVLHELGHWLALEHPGDCGSKTTAEDAAAMDPDWVIRRTLNSDDSAGASNMYP